MERDLPDVFAIFNLPPVPHPDDKPSPAEILRRTVRKAMDDMASSSAALGSVPKSTAPMQPTMRDADDGLEHSVHDSLSANASDEENNSGLANKAGDRSKLALAEDMEELTMLDTADNRKLLDAIKAKHNPKKRKPKRSDISIQLGTPPGLDPQPLPLMAKYEQIRAQYKAITYPRLGDDTDESDGGDGSDTGTSTDDDSDGHKPECFLCAWGDEFHDGIAAPLLAKFNSIFTKYYGKAENAAVAQMARLFFMARIWQPGMPELTEATVLEHIEGFHTLEPRIVIGELTRRYLRLHAVLEDHIFYTGNGFNRYIMSAYNACSRMIFALYNCDIPRMNFYNAKIDLDLKQMGAFTQLMPSFTQKKERAARNPMRNMKRAREDAKAERSAKRARQGMQQDVAMLQSLGALVPPDDQVLI